MYVYRNISRKVVWSFAWKYLIIFSIYGTACYFLIHYLDHQGFEMTIPFSPLSVIGIAVAFYVGFKNNQSYDRFWEARKIWGGIVNSSRTWGNQVLSFVTLAHSEGKITVAERDQIRKELIYRHMAWTNALRLQLRRAANHSIDFEKRNSKHFQGRPQEEHWKEEVGKFILDANDVPYYIKVKNTATQMVRKQGEQLENCFNIGLIEDFRHMELMGTLTELYSLQGKCERIKNTPLPRQYSYFSNVFIWVFILLLPFGLIGEFSSMGHDVQWLAVPVFTLIAWIFITMEQIGDSSEDPFENFINDVPMTALCRTIEIDLREMLGEEDIPQGISAVDGVLM